LNPNDKFETRFLSDKLVAMSDLTSAELKSKIAAILKEADLETTSAKKVRMQLEEDLKADLTGRKEEIGKIIQV
jgi:upstream activation factor subunit UAF30